MAIVIILAADGVQCWYLTMTATARNVQLVHKHYTFQLLNKFENIKINMLFWLLNFEHIPQRTLLILIIQYLKLHFTLCTNTVRSQWAFSCHLISSIQICLAFYIWHFAHLLTQEYKSMAFHFYLLQNGI